MTDVSKTYLKAVKRALGKMDKTKRQFLTEIASNLEVYLSAHPDADRAALEREFGSPEALALQFVDGKELSSLRRAKNRWILFLVIALAALALLTWGIVEIVRSNHDRGPIFVTDDQSSNSIVFDDIIN